MKAYKGFNKDGTCRGFLFEEGKTYEEPEAKLCESGFHACENPLDCFRYYYPGRSIYREVDLDATDEVSREDSKRVGKEITIGAELSVAQICKLHFEYTSARCTNNEAGKDYARLTGGNKAMLSGGEASSLSGGDDSSLSGGARSSLSGGARSSLSGGDDSSLSGGARSSLSGGDDSSLSGGDDSSLSGGDDSSLSGGDDSSLSGGARSSLSGGDDSSLSGGDSSSLSGGARSSLSGGDASVMACFNGKAKGGIGSLICIANRKYDFSKSRYVITDYASGIVDGENIEADTWYKCENGKLVEVLEDKT